MELDLSTKTYVVTGATSGIGLSTVKALLRSGAFVIGIGRSKELCVDIEKNLRNQYDVSKIHFLIADLSVQSEIKGLADNVQHKLAIYNITAVDGLVNNAGTFTYWFTLTADGIEKQWAVNHLAPFLLTSYLFPALNQSEDARIVTVSSESHRGARINWDDPQLRRYYNGLLAYSNTKLANILFTLELNKRFNTSSNISAFALDPGLVKTDIGMKGTPRLVQRFWKIRRSGGVDPDQPAQAIIYLLTNESIRKSERIYWKNGQPGKASHAAMDVQTAGRLWSLSEKMCGINGVNYHGSI